MNTLLSLMRSIEQEAKDIYASYEAKAETLADQKEAALTKIFSQYEQETQALLQTERENFEHAHRHEKETVKERINRQQQVLQSILTEKKVSVVTELVDKVVERYGH